ncbi:MAG: MMPL family transporter, partial [Propionibacteriaceae bacterium]|nr:MMPL family transporter [Propionibacteriaceae bacterium]
MPTFLYSIARQCARNRMRVLLGWALALTLTVGAAWVFAAPFNETISIPDSESASAQATLSNTFPEVADQTATVVIIAPTEQRLDSQSAKEAISAYLYTLSELPYIKGVIPPFTEPFSGMESKDATRALAYLRIDGPAAGFHSGDLADLTAQVKTLRYFLDGADVELGGDLYTVPNRSFSAVEASCIFLVAIILVIVLKSLMASAIVLTACLIGTVSTISIGLLARNFGAINFLSLTISIMIGSVLGILFALPIVARHRSQITSGMEITESIALAVGRSGNTIISQSLAVAVTAGMMLCVGIPPFTATGVLVLLTTAINVFSSCTALPALLGLANEWLAAESSPATVPVRSKLPGGARFALKHPIPAIALTALILIGTA